MNWLCRNLYKKEKGFTLVELMVVIIILAVLTGIAIPSYMALRNRARVSATRSEIANIGTAIELYMADNESYPPASGDGSYPDILETDGYMSDVPDNDAWGNAFTYARSDATNYTLTSGGPDGDTTTGDDIVLTNGIMSE